MKYLVNRFLRSGNLRTNLLRKETIVSYIRSQEEFKTDVKESKIPVIVDFKAEWCGPCKVLTPRLLELEQKFTDRIRLAILDIDHPDNEKMVTEHKINAVPTLIVFDSGKETARVTGLQSEDALEDMVAKLL